MNLINNNNLEKEFLDNYDVSQYERPSVTNDIVIFTTEDKKESNKRKVPPKGLQVLLIKREDYPHKGKWAIPGGFIKIDESLKESAMGRLRDETGVENVYIEQLYTFGAIGRDSRTRVISIANVALVSKDKISYRKDVNANESQWFWIEKKLLSKKVDDKHIVTNWDLTLINESEDIKIHYEITEKQERSYLRNVRTIYKSLEENNEELAFDHYHILNVAINRLRNKVEYTPIAFYLLPRLFTVKELQNVYEAIMGRTILNFRRKIEDMIMETDEKIEGKPFRPAQVYKFNENWEHEF